MKIALEQQDVTNSRKKSLMRSETGMNSSMTEEKLLQYLRCHQGLQHIGVVANANRCSVGRVLELSLALRKTGLIEVRAYSSGFHLQLITQSLKASGTWS
ncbi:MAG TPA: hypothetical protein VN939_01025 [Chthoniobacterales bacterium]|nr:hypothetical protein [Chthoniobacterales bacterium]